MVTTQLVPVDIADLYEVHEWRNATGVLATSNPAEWAEIQSALRSFRLHRSEVLTPGGRRSSIVDRLESPLKAGGWIEKQFATAIEIDGVSTPSPTHKVDCFKNRVALEVEWNNKDPFFDRDLNNFRLLFDLFAKAGRRYGEVADIGDRAASGGRRRKPPAHVEDLTPAALAGADHRCQLFTSSGGWLPVRSPMARLKAATASRDLVME
jgi:Restriction endonuclease BglII